MSRMSLESLPQHLRERSRLHTDPSKNLATETLQKFVLYWMRTAVRSDENPALDVARLLADQRGARVLIYHAISQH